MKHARLYKAEWVREADWPYADEPARDGYPMLKPEPEGWREYALEKWPERPEHEFWPDGHKPFFWPNTDRIYRSRSAARRIVDIINYWGGKAVLVECTPQWETVEAANARMYGKHLVAVEAVS